MSRAEIDFYEIKLQVTKIAVDSSSRLYATKRQVDRFDGVFLPDAFSTGRRVTRQIPS